MVPGSDGPLTSSRASPRAGGSEPGRTTGGPGRLAPRHGRCVMVAHL